MKNTVIILLAISLVAISLIASMASQQRDQAIQGWASALDLVQRLQALDAQDQAAAQAAINQFQECIASQPQSI
jgi:hypothetical protein